MNKFISAYGTGSSWAYAAKECVEGLLDKHGTLPPLRDGYQWLGFIYATGAYAADMASILTYLRQKTNIDYWSGTIGSGIIVDDWEYHDNPALGVMVGQFPENSFKVLPTFDDITEPMADDVLQWLSDNTPGFGISHGDPSNPDIVTLIEELSLSMGGALGGSFLVGGLTASSGNNYQIANQITGNGVSGVAFDSRITVVSGLSQGCVPLNQTHMVTEAVDNVIMALDGKPALDVLKEDVGELLSRDLTRLAGFILAAIPVAGSDTGDFMVRNLTAIDIDRGWIAIGESIETGDKVTFVRRDPASARADMDRMLDDIKARMPSEPKGGLYFSCVGRGPYMFGTAGEEARIIGAALSSDSGPLPIVGFFGNGEISNSRLYGYTGVLVLFF